MSDVLHFLPWLRRGLGATVTNEDHPGTGALPRNAPVTATVEINDLPAHVTLALRPIDHATGIDTTQIIRRYPAPGSADAEYGYFPLVDLSAPDLPWILTPAKHDETTGRLRPWIVLVCVEENRAELVPAADGRPACLFVATDQLPELAESYAWAHVQSAVPRDDVEGSLTDAPGSVIARLVCPLRLKPNTRYRLAIVAAFTADGDTVVPAWPRTDGDTEELVVYDTWTMSTGEAGSFEELCERLGPATDPDLILGLHRTDVTDLGPLKPWPRGTKRVVVEVAGAMWDSDVTPAGLGDLADDFAEPVTKLLAQSDHRVVLGLDDPDPVVAPPCYGSFAAGSTAMPTATPKVPTREPPKQRPQTGWLAELNLDPNHRAAAGLGAEIVRIHQERFMAMAWDQAGQLRETNRQLSLTRLQSEVARTWKERASRLDPLQRVALMRPQLTFVRDATGTAPRRSLIDSTVPNALVSPAYVRVARPGGVVAAAAARRNPEGSAWHSSLGDAFGDPDNRQVIGFAAHTAPLGTRFDDTRGDLDPSAPGGSSEPGGSGEPDEPGEPDNWPGDGPLPQLPRRPPTGGRRRQARIVPSPPDVPDEVTGTTRPLPRSAASTTSTDRFDLEATADLVSASIAPIEIGRSRITARIPGLVEALEGISGDELPTRVAVGPVIDEALVWSLVELSPQLVLPGVELFPNNAVRVVETNPAFVAAFLAGANHEMARELLWREYPADLAATVFRRFWDRPDAAVHDIEPMTEWKPQQRLADLASAGGESVVVLIRGDLVHHYPTVRVLLVDPSNVAHLPTFGGWIPPDVRFMAFDVVDADVVTTPGSGWRVVLEEQPTEPRFGLDTIAEGDEQPDLETWNDLSWDHLVEAVEPGAHLLIEGALARGPRKDQGATWGHNSAHMAVATFQAPYRLTFDVDDLIGPSTRPPMRATAAPAQGAATRGLRGRGTP